jgi:hypothetical protein
MRAGLRLKSARTIHSSSGALRAMNCRATSMMSSASFALVGPFDRACALKYQRAPIWIPSSVAS